MSAIDDIFKEYTRMREHGLEVQEALRALRVYVEPLGSDTREALATYLRAWEKERLTKPQRPIAPIKQIHEPLPEPGTSEFIWLECPNCGKKNRAKEVFCYHCGQILQQVAGKFDTKQFKSATNELFSDDYFGTDSVMLLTPRNSFSSYELRPQLRSRELVLGRVGENNEMRPDIDLSSLGADEQGVSRLHLAIVYVAEGNCLQAYDLGSANGSFLNGQKLHPNERRTIRHADEIRLGRLSLKVKFLHPGELVKND